MRRGFNIIRMYLFIFIVIQSIFCAEDGDYPLYRQALWGTTRVCCPTIWSNLTNERATWDVIETPGHTTDHLSFYNRETGAMFTGDLFISQRQRLCLMKKHCPYLGVFKENSKL